MSDNKQFKVKKKTNRSKAGRPTVFTQSTIQILEEAFLKGHSDTEACLIANIAPSSFYLYCQQNEDFRTRKEELKQNPLAMARENIYQALNKKDIDISKWYLERKNREFAPLTKNEHTGEDGQPIKLNIIAGGGYIPKPVEVDATSEQGALPRATEIQDPDLASQS